MTFEDCIAEILKHEGGYVNHKHDPGGETNFGISKRSYPNVNIKKLTIEQATEIYKRDFWDKLKIEELPVDIRLIYFDCAVNQGPNRAAQLYKEATKHGQDGAAARFAKARLNHYASLPSWKVFGGGWARRLFDVTIKSLTGL